MSNKLYRIITGFENYMYRVSNLISDIRFFWRAGDHSNLYFIMLFVALIAVLSGFIIYTVNNYGVSKELACLTKNIYHEARGEPDEGKYAVASVTLNRVASKHYPDTICKVVYQKRWDYLRKRYVGAFSWTELDEPVLTDSKSWKKAARVAEEVYHNPEAHNLKQALFYHARHIRPSWARKKTSVAKIGRHIFYN